MPTLSESFPSPPDQIPSSAVEMPGSADIPGLNVQFGALDFGSEATLPDFGPVETCVSVASRAPAPQSQTNLYSKPLRWVTISTTGVFS